MDRLVSMVKVVAAGDMRVPPGVVRRVSAKIRAGATPEESELTYAPGRLNGRNATGTVSSMPFPRVGLSRDRYLQCRTIRQVSLADLRR